MTEVFGEVVVVARGGGWGWVCISGHGNGGVSSQRSRGRAARHPEWHRDLLVEIVGEVLPFDLGVLAGVDVVGIPARVAVADPFQQRFSERAGEDDVHHGAEAVLLHHPRLGVGSTHVRGE